MGFIAAFYYYMNRADPDCGTTFAWVTRAIGPKSGWISGWGIVMADLIIMPSLAQISGIYLFLLFGGEGFAASAFWTTLVGIAFIMGMTWICVVGIELNGRRTCLSQRLPGTSMAPMAPIRRTALRLGLRARVAVAPA